MIINGHHRRTIWEKENDPTTIMIIDQRRLPHELLFEELRSVEDAARAIREMHVRGAPLIGATAAYGLYLAALEATTLRGRQASGHLSAAADKLRATRPTAIDLFHAIDRVLDATARSTGPDVRVEAALQAARAIVEESVEACRRIGEYGLPLIEAVAQSKPGPVNILTHCNAGWMACVDYGTATAPIYLAHDQGIDIHVWVDETRPRNQGARITAFELLQHGVPHTVITDNAGGHLMQNDMVDMVIVGSDRTTRNGDVANKIGTYLKALAAVDNEVPFYVALPSSSIDWKLQNGLRDIPIEERDSTEVQYVQGMENGVLKEVLLTPPGSPALNYGFDITPARLVSGLITDRGICAASEKGLVELYPEQS